MRLNNLFAILIVALAACGAAQKTYHSSVVTVMVDNTSASKARYDILSKDGLWETFGGSDSVYGKFNWTYVTDVSFNTENSLELRPAKENENSLEIKVSRRKFLKKLTDSTSLYHKFLDSCAGTPHSSIYEPVCRALTELVKTGTEKKTLIILSDMIENSSYANFYHLPMKKGTIDTDATIALLEKSGAVMPDGDSNLRVIILYQPTAKTDETFSNCMRVWGKLFNSHHISYEVRANL